MQAAVIFCRIVWLIKLATLSVGSDRQRSKPQGSEHGVQTQNSNVNWLLRGYRGVKESWYDGGGAQAEIKLGRCCTDEALCWNRIRRKRDWWGGRHLITHHPTTERIHHLKKNTQVIILQVALRGGIYYYMLRVRIKIMEQQTNKKTSGPQLWNQCDISLKRLITWVMMAKGRLRIVEDQAHPLGGKSTFPHVQIWLSICEILLFPCSLYSSNVQTVKVPDEASLWQNRLKIKSYCFVSINPCSSVDRTHPECPKTF